MYINLEQYQLLYYCTLRYGEAALLPELCGHNFVGADARLPRRRGRQRGPGPL